MRGGFLPGRRLASSLVLLWLFVATNARGEFPPLADVGFEPAMGVEFERPLWVGHPGDGTNRLFVVEQAGTIWSVDLDAGAKKRTLVLDWKKRTRQRHNEEGMLGLAFHPDFATNRSVFVHYSAGDPRRGVVSRFLFDRERNTILPDTEAVVLELEQPYGNHNGGDLRFGPDGYLYISFGDGGAANDPRGAGQDLSTWLASILRIDVDSETPYAIPADNPFVDTARAKPEIFAYGLRNVWRFSFDRETGELWAGDVGQNRWEEIDIVRAGGNYGWNTREGFHEFRRGPDRDYLDPIVDYPRDLARSITGGFVYRGSQVSSLAGAYVHADYETGYIWALWCNDEAGQKRVTRHHEIGRASRISSFGEDRDGELYFCSFDGKIYRFVSK